MMSFLLFGRGEALVHAAPNVIKHNCEDSNNVFSADFRKFSFDCLAHSEPRHEGEAPFVDWLFARFHVQRLATARRGAPPFCSRLSIGVSRGGISTLGILFYYLDVRSSVGVPPRLFSTLKLLEIFSFGIEPPPPKRNR
jgi:hypothetical protein